MRRKLPSLSALEAFESVARLGSTAKASAELGRTQSAVSRQILNLESFLGLPLFEREQSKLVLNAAGGFLFGSIGATLDRIQSAITKTRNFGEAGKKLRLCVWPTFGARWLASRLMKLPPDLGIGIEVSTDIQEGYSLNSPQVDAVILHGTGDWPDVSSYPIASEELVVVAAPQKVVELGHDLMSYDWLTMDSRTDAWETWIKARAEPGTPVKNTRLYRISLLTELLCLGLGAGIVPSIYVQRELENGMLVAPFGAPLPTGKAYYLCYRSEDADIPHYVRFREWLISLA